MRVWLLAMTVAIGSGCVFADYADHEQALEVAMAIPPATTTLEFTAYDGGECDELGQLADGGSALDDIDGRRFEVGMTETMPVKPGTFTFEAIALDTSQMPEVRLAAGCAPATIRSKQTTLLRITLVDF